MADAKRQLNKEQQKAVEHGVGPLLIIAGAGTGKTTVITERIKHLITTKIVAPSEILALTFTEKAAREMETRVDEALPYGYTQLWTSTFHSFCDRVMRAHGIHIGLNPQYRLLSDTDATMLFRRELFNFPLSYFRPLGNPNKFIAGMLTHFSRLKDEDIAPKQYSDWVSTQNTELKSQNEEDLLELKKYEELAKVYALYEELKIKEGVMDFADLIAQTLSLFRQRPNVLKEYRQQFKFILIDEFQDTNLAQYELIKLLAPPSKDPNLTVVGDDNQSIYKFRGAAISNILSFKEDYPSSAQIILNDNYRSYQYILDASYTLIKHNDPDTLEARLGISKKLKSSRGNTRSKVEYLHADRVENEAEAVVKKIKELIVQSSKVEEEKYSYKDMAVLVRANAHAESFVRAFSRHGIPFQFLGPAQLFRQPEIKELISYLKILANFEDDVSLFHVLSMDYFALSSRDLVAINNFSKRLRRSLFEALEAVVSEEETNEVTLPKVSDETKQKIYDFVEMVHKHMSLLTKETAGQLLFFFLQDSGMLPHILEYKLPLDEKKANNISTFFGKLKSYEAEHEDASVKSVLDWIMLSMEVGESPKAGDTDWMDNDAVNILTVHSSKGLEFPVVFLVNLVSQRFPSTERKEQIPIPTQLIKEILPEGDYHLQEERRLFYVGMTRAKDHLFLTAANFYGEGKREKKVSPFIAEALGIDTSPLTVSQEEQLSLLDWKTESGSPKKGSFSPLEVTPHKVTYLSYSQIDTFLLCPLHYKLRYILKIPTAPSPAASFGSSIHKALFDFYTEHKAGTEVDADMLTSLLDKNWIRDGYSTKKYEEMMKDRGRGYLRGFYEKSFSSETKILALEEMFSLPLKDKKRFLRIGGKIDRIDDLGNGEIEIVDYKTGKIPTKREMEASLQLSMYAIAASDIPSFPYNRKVEQVKLSLYYFDEQIKVTTTRTREQLESEKKRILEIAATIENSDFRCSGHMFCAQCDYQQFCGIIE